MNSYKWEISTMKVGELDVGDEILNDVLVAVTEVRCVVSDGTNTDRSTFLSFTAPLDLDAPEPGNFTPMNDLTLEQVEAWVLPKIPEADLVELKARADAMLALEIAANLPTAPVPGPVFGAPPPEPMPEPEDDVHEGDGE